MHSFTGKRLVTKILGLALLIILAWPANIIASPVSKRVQLQRLKNQVDSIDRQIELINEEYLQAKLKLNNTKIKISSNTQALKTSQSKLGFYRKALAKRVKTLYKSSSDNLFEYVFQSKSFNELITNMDYIIRIGQNDSRLIAKVFKLTKKIETNQRDLGTNLKKQKNVVIELSRKKAAIESEISRKKRLIRGLEAELRAYVARQERRQLQAASRRFEQETPSYSGPMPTNAPRSQVVQIAMQQLGKPYQWAAAGPDRFDCSGLTMYVYAKIGVSLPHSSRAQSQMGQFVPRSALQPGDLVFSGNPIHHVGIYIGGGRMISAPQTGDVVKISPLRSNYRWARRP